MNRPLGLIGVPTSAGAFAPGQERAPQVLRDAGLAQALRRRGGALRDHGDCELWRWQPDRAARRAQNLDRVLEIVRDTARRVRTSIDDGETTLVVGGDCTVGIGTVGGHVSTGESVGLIYFDSHADLNVPESVRPGALDWMGLAHMLAEPGAAEELVHAGSRVPLLEVEQVLLFAWGPEQATEFERAVIDRRGITAVPVDQVAADPDGSAAHASKLIESRCERLLIHFDVDAIDFTDVPLSENCGRNEGLAYDHALRALHMLVSRGRLDERASAPRELDFAVSRADPSLGVAAVDGRVGVLPPPDRHGAAGPGPAWPWRDRHAPGRDHVPTGDTG